MKKRCLILLAFVLALVPLLTIASPAAACVEGYTPGYWKNFKQHPWSIYTPTTTIMSAFELGSPAPGFAADATLMDTLNKGGGGVYAFMRQAVAQLLNTTLGGVSTSHTTWFIGLVKAVLANPDGLITHSDSSFVVRTWNIEQWKNYVESFHS